MSTPAGLANENRTGNSSFFFSVTNALYILVYYVQLTWLLIDSIGGYFLHQSDGSSALNGIVRGGITLILLLLLLVDNNIKNRSFILLSYVFLVTLSLLHTLIFQSVPQVSIIFKLLLLPTWLVIVRHQLLTRRLDKKKVANIIFFNTSILFFNVLISFFGVGYANYGMTADGQFIGGHGFFYAGNEVGGVILTLSALGLWFISTKSYILNIFLSALYMICGVGILSKTAVFGVLVNTSIALFVVNARKALVGILSVSAIALFYMDSIFQKIALFWGRISYFVKIYGWETVFLGGQKRHNEISRYLREIDENPLLLLVGSGWNGTTESNLFDLLEAFGVSGLFFYAIPIVFFVKSFSVLKRRNERRLIILVSGFLIFLVSLLAGHILQSAMISVFLAFFLNSGFIQKDSSNP